MLSHKYTGVCTACVPVTRFFVRTNHHRRTLSTCISTTVLRRFRLTPQYLCRLYFASRCPFDAHRLRPLRHISSRIPLQIAQCCKRTSMPAPRAASRIHWTSWFKSYFYNNSSLERKSLQQIVFLDIKSISFRDALRDILQGVNSVSLVEEKPSVSLQHC